MSLTETAFWWHTNLPPNSILSWQDMQVQFTNHFACTKPGVTLRSSQNPTKVRRVCRRIPI